jgi:hypothetical protein
MKGSDLALAPEEKIFSESDRTGVEAVLRFYDKEDAYCESPRVAHHPCPFLNIFRHSPGKYWDILTYLLHRAELFLRRIPFLNKSRNSLHFMEPEGSLPHIQITATCRLF